jgi:beta-exotoxin I transport system permease protein
MRTDVARLDLRLRRRGLIGAAAGMMVYAVLIVALYPTFKGDTSLNSLTDKSSTLAALFGATGSLTTVEGWLSANLYANFVPLVALLLTIGYGASCIAGQDEDNTLGLTATLPMSRRSICAQKATALLVLAGVVPTSTLACILVGPRFDLNPDWTALIETTLAVTLLAADFGLLAVAVGALTGSRGTATGVASAAAATSYLLSSLSPVIDAIHQVRFASLFFWAVGDDQLLHGVSWYATGILFGVGVLLLAASIVAFDRFDVH